MPDNTRLNTGAGGDLVATDELSTVNGAPADTGLKVQRVKVGWGADGALQDVTDAAPMPVRDDESRGVLFRILQVLLAPLGYDKSLQRYRQTAIVESGTITTVTTVTTVSTVTAVSSLTNLAAIGGYNAQMQVLDQNRAAWASNVRARIT